MLFYNRMLGEWSKGGNSFLSGCYAGMDIGKNNAAMQEVHDVGPLPAGIYTIGLMVMRHPLGPSMMLTPDLTNEMFGRSGFFIHLDNPAHPGFSSDGCIVCQNDPSMTGLAKLQKLNAMVASGENRVTVQ
jgi:Protein of unknown function (DUF2778)